MRVIERHYPNDGGRLHPGERSQPVQRGVHQRPNLCVESGYASGTSRMEAQTVWSISKPGFMVDGSTRLRIKRTAADSRTIETASCPDHQRVAQRPAAVRHLPFALFERRADVRHVCL